MKCRFCGEELSSVFCDLGKTPIANSYVDKNNKNVEKVFPLCAYVCEKCKLVQVPIFETPKDIFTDYAYFSSISNSWLKHCKEYCNKAVEKFKLNKNSLVVEIASNDGYLLNFFIEKGIPVLGIDPAKNVVEIALSKGINTICDFFGYELATKIEKEYKKADLIIGNNVLAHVPDINDFVKGLKFLLKEDSVITLEFPHLMKLMQENQFDTIYHEHFFYLSILSVNKIVRTHGLRIFDVEELSTHGGSVRVYLKHDNDIVHIVSNSVEHIIMKEKDYGLDKIETYINFNDKVKTIRDKAVKYLVNEKRKGKKIAAFGAPAKGNTFLNYCNIGTDIIDFTVDETPYKQGLLLPGVHIPIYSLEKLYENKPDIVIVLPWNWIEEILPKLSFIKEAGGFIVTFIPDIRIY